MECYLTIFKKYVPCFGTTSKRLRDLFKIHCSGNLPGSTNVYIFLLFLDYQLFVSLNVVVKTVSQYTCM